MDYVIVDLEWNQPLSESTTIQNPIRFDSEIIEIGAVKLNDNLDVLDEYQAFVRPQFYPVMHGDVSRITKIRSQLLQGAPYFTEVLWDFLNWCGDNICFCTWGTNDIPVLYDNMIMHEIHLNYPLFWCDLQQVFGAEIMRDGKRWGLVDAIDTLRLPKERSHDALNDARNTCSLCKRVDLISHCGYYGNVHVNYDIDRRNGLIAGRSYSSVESALSDDDMKSIVCPYCGEKVKMDRWVRVSKRSSVCYGRCSEGDEFFARIRSRRHQETKNVFSRMVYEMSDLLWDDYQDALEREAKMLAIAG